MSQLVPCEARWSGRPLSGLVLLSLVWSFAADARGADVGRAPMAFEVEGELITTMFSAKGEVRRATRHDFMVRVSGDRWLMLTEDLDVREGSKKSVLRREISCDGRDVFELNVMPSNMVSQATNRSTNRLYAFARGGTFPAKALPSELVLWLAFCSAPRLAAGTNLPSFRVPLEAAAQPVRCQSELLPASGLPLRYAQTAPGFLQFQDGKQPDRLDFPPPFDRGFVEFEYRATALTNLGEWVVPLAFEAEFFTIALGAGTNGVRYMPNRRRGMVTRIRAAASEQWQPDIAEAANVYDYRFTNRAGRLLTYVETNQARWIERDDPHLRQTVQAKLPMPVYGRKAEAVERRRGVGRAGVVAAISTPTLVFVAWALFVKVRTRNKT